MTARAADPSTLFRGGGRTLGDLAREITTPNWVPEHRRLEYQLSILLTGIPPQKPRHYGVDWDDDFIAHRVSA